MSASSDQSIPIRSLFLKWENHEVPIRHPILVGSDHASCDIVLKESSLSPIQCLVRPWHGQYQAVNLSGGQEVTLDGNVLVGRSRIRPGQVLRFGTTDVTIAELDDREIQTNCQNAVSYMMQTIGHVQDAAVTSQTILDITRLACRASRGAVFERGDSEDWALAGGDIKGPEVIYASQTGAYSRPVAAVLAGLRDPDYARLGVSKVISDREMVAILGMNTEMMDLAKWALLARFSLSSHRTIAILLIRNFMDSTFEEVDRAILQKFSVRIGRRFRHAATGESDV